MPGSCAIEEMAVVVGIVRVWWVGVWIVIGSVFIEEVVLIIVY